MDKNDNIGCISFVLVVAFLFTFVVACSESNSLEKEKQEKDKLRNKISALEEKVNMLEDANKNYKWMIEQVPYVIEYGCKGE